VPFLERDQGFMQDVGNRDNKELSQETLTPRLRRLSVEFLGRCQSVGNWMTAAENGDQAHMLRLANHSRREEKNGIENKAWPPRKSNWRGYACAASAAGRVN
jgi:hypothetical protein